MQNKRELALCRSSRTRADFVRERTKEHIFISQLYVLL
jgi:hypothetical protein